MSNEHYDTYDELEKSFGISPMSPESSYAETAWNCALLRAIGLLEACAPTEETVEGLLAMARKELRAINTDFYAR